MGRLIVVTIPELVPGYQLAGVEAIAAATPEEAKTVLRQVFDQGEASLIVIPQNLLPKLDSRLRRQLETSIEPIVMTIPGSVSSAPTGARRRYITELIRRAIGFHITFSQDEAEET